MIPPINFDALFASAVQRAQANAAKESETSDDTTH
jgi:preprotein translocase subunit SecB